MLIGVRAISSVGSERMPYKHEVTGSNPVSPMQHVTYRGRSSTWLEHCPVTAEVAGSSPVVPVVINQDSPSKECISGGLS